MINQIEGNKHAVTGGYNLEATGDHEDVEVEILDKKNRGDKRRRWMLQDDDSAPSFNSTRGKRTETLSSVADAFKTLVHQQGEAVSAKDAAAAERAEDRRLIALRHTEVLAAQASSDGASRDVAKQFMVSQAATGSETAKAMMTAADKLAQSLTSKGMGLTRMGAAMEKRFCFDFPKSPAPVSRAPDTNGVFGQE